MFSVYKVLKGRCNVVSECVLSLTICKLSNVWLFGSLNTLVLPFQLERERIGDDQLLLCTQG